MRQKLFIAIVAVIIAITTVSVYHFTQQININYYQGQRLFLKGNYLQAIPFYVKSIEEGSDKRKTYQELAYCYLWTGNSEKAIELFRDISKKNPSDYSIKESLAEAYSWNKKYDEAIKIFKEIINKTDSSWIKGKLAEVYLWDDQPQEAKTILYPLVKKEPDNYKLKLLWGKALYYTGESEKASKIFEELLKEENE